MIEMDDDQSDSEFAPNGLEDPQQGDRVGASGNGHCDSIPGHSHALRLDVSKNRLFE
jgi:hypothetical protein